MATNWTQQVPLPAGWEAKWDPGQNRYFFIDHSTKKTTWVDPRTTQPAVANPWQQQQQAAVRHSPRPGGHHENIALRQLNTQPAKPAWQKQETSLSTSDKAKAENLKKMFPTAQEWKINNVLTRNENNMAEAIAELERSGYQQQDVTSQKIETAIVNKLNQEFTGAEVGVIRDIVQCFDNNEARARSELKALGYASVKETSRPSSGKKTKAKAKASSPARAQSPARVSDADKERLKATLGAEFPDYSDAMVVIALDSCSYKLDSARKILQNMQKSRKKSEEKSKEASPAKTSGRSTSPVAASSTSSSGVASPSPAVTFPEFNTTFTIPTLPASPPSARAERKPTTQTTSVASRLAKSKTSGSTQRTAVTTRKTVAAPAQYTSANRTEPAGPNPDLAKGPDKDLLIDDYQPYRGPNPEIRHGPDVNNVQGPSRACGPDRSYLQGQNSQMRCGADADLWTGSSAMSMTTQRLLVSEI